MRTLIVLAIGLVLFAGLATVAAVRPLPDSLGGHGGAAGKIEARLEAAAQEAVRALDYEWLSVTVDGQIATLTGDAPREAERADARASILRAAGPGGPWRGGIVAVRDETVLAPPVSPFEWRAVKEGRSVTLTGVAPSRAIRTDLDEYARALFQGGVANELVIARGAPDEKAWLTAARTALAQLASLEEGRAILKDARLRIEGAAPSAQARERITAAIVKLPQPFTAAAVLDAPEEAAASSDGGAESRPETGTASATDTLAPPTPAPAATPVQAPAPAANQINDMNVCQAMLDGMLAVEQVQFQSGRAEIEKESYPLLDRLSLVAKRCARASLVVEGHTDSTGVPSANMRLSERRAQAVADYLVLQDIPSARVRAQGFGDTRPIADNETEEGRIRNRRIAVRVDS